MIKKYFILLFILMSSFQALAFKARSELKLNTNEELTKSLLIECSKGESLCKNICNTQESCSISETICEDCATESSQVMHTVFTDLTSVFKSDLLAITDEDLIRFFKNKKFMTISHDLFLNMFTPEKKEQIKTQFESMCNLKNIQNATLLTTVSDQNQIDQLVGVICQDQTDHSVVLPILFNPLFSNKSNDFWNNLNEQVGLAIQNQGLKLKMSDSLSLPAAVEEQKLP